MRFRATPETLTDLLRLIARAMAHEQRATYNVDQFRLDEARAAADATWEKITAALESVLSDDPHGDDA